MIIIDGRQSTMDIGAFANLEEILVKVVEEEITDGNIVTDVFVNKEAFSEIYPHHAEDIESAEISSVEVRTVPMGVMAAEVNQEMFTVIKIMQNGAKGVSGLLRQGDTAEGLEVLQDLLDVTRHFLGTISVLHQRFPAHDKDALDGVATTLDGLLTEMSDVMTDQDWLLLADLLEYEFHPACDEWNDILTAFAEDLAEIKVE